MRDFYHIFDRIPEGVNNNWHGITGEARIMRSSIAAGPCLSKQKSLRSKIRCYLGTTTNTNSCHISFLDLPQCFQSIVNNNSLLIIDSGVSVCITPHQSDFVSHQKSKMKIKDLSSSNTVAGEGLIRWKVEDIAG